MEGSLPHRELRILSARPPALRSLHAASALAVAALLSIAAPSAAQQVRFGYIDSARIFQEFHEAKEAQARFDRQVQGWRSEAEEKEKVVTALRAEVQDQGPILSSLKRQEKEAALQRAISDYERFIQEVWGPRGRAAQENERATGEVVAKIRVVVEKVAGEKGLNLVLDAASGFLIYADKSFDLTAEVLQELNLSAPPAGSN
jgi:outer membrane protein